MNGVNGQSIRGAARAIIELSKPRLTGLVVVTTALGYLLANGALETDRPLLLAGERNLAPGGFSWLSFIGVILGTHLLSWSASAANQRIEKDFDALMERTKNRPLPSGRMTVGAVTAVSIVTGLLGMAILLLTCNILTAALGLTSHLLYILVYTPLKRRSSLNTLVGAITGAIPPMMGWTAAADRVDPGAWVLFGVLFLWQIPHFLAIAWMYREDYARGGYRMLTVVDPTGDATATEILLYSMVLLPVSFMATVVGLTGWLYLIGAACFGLGFLGLGVRFYRKRTYLAARQIFLASLFYLPMLIGLMVLDPTTITGGFAD